MNSSPPLIIGDKDLESISDLHPVRLDSRQFDEDWLQKLLFMRPDLLPTRDIDPAFDHLIPLAREFPVTVGSIDALYVTSRGALCLVETKLWRNPEAHRTVLAQILEYARHLTNMNYSDFKAKVEAIATRDGRPKDLLKIVSAKSPKSEFDSVAFEEGLRRSLATGNFLLLIVGDRIRPEVAMLSEIMVATPNLEFTLRLVEIAFYRLDKKNDWPVVAVPSIVGQTREVTRAVVKIRYEQKQPEVEVSAVEESRRGRIDIEAFLKSLPKGLDEIFRPYLESWIEGPLVISWGSVGFSLRYSRGNKLLTIIEGYPTMIAIFVERQLVDWGNPMDAYRAYYSHIERIPEVQRVHSLNRKYVYYNKLTQDETRIILEATDQLAQALVTWSASSQ